MRKAKVFVNCVEFGVLTELEFAKKYRFEYLESYNGKAVSHTLPLSKQIYELDNFLPEGYQIEGLLKIGKVDRNDFFAIGDDLVGNITVKKTIA